ncbi:MAG: TonB-dependent receptor, partial [bacterium]|nr:TonB-dependent receptor [bacterium]
DADVYEGGHCAVQGDLYDGTSDGVVAGERTLSTVGGGNALARFTHEFSDTHNVSAQLYYDRTDRNLALLLYELDTIDLELKHQFEPLPGLDFVWGAEYRYQNDDSKTGIPATADMVALQALFDGINFFSPGDAPATAEALIIDPSSRKTNLFSGFAQLEGRAFDEQLRATLGTKLEDNSYSGFEIQPSARVAYVPNDTMTLWTSVSRAVRTPSRANQDITTLNTTNNGIPVLDLSNDDFVSEELMAYEAGFRIQPHESVHFDVAGFYNDYDNLELTSTTDAVRIVPPGLFLLKRTQGNHAKGEAWGIELFTRVQIPLEVPALKQWTVDGTYSFIDVDVKRDSGVAVPKAFGGDNADATGITEANHTVGLRSRMSLACNLEFDLNWFYVSRIKDVGPGDNDVESYHRVDLRAAWLPTDNVETSVVVQNLFEAAHREWNTELFVPATKIPRTVYGKVVLKF